MKCVLCFRRKKSVFHQVDADFTMRVLPDLMETSIRIIIENAVKFSGDAPVVEVSAIRDVENLLIAVSDNGVGIDQTADEKYI